MQRETEKSIRIGGSLLELERPLVMAIVNATPDSFWAGSRTPDAEGLRRRVAQCREQGADILDIGGYSTRPGADCVSADEEMKRLATALQAAREVWPEAVISVDTFRASVARECVEQFGVAIINDVSGGTLDPEMYAAVAEMRCAYVLMHMRGTPSDMQQLTDYGDVAADVLSDLMHKASRLRDMGVADIILDPGFGFAKTIEQNYRLLACLEAFADTGMPVLAGLSRKSMIWRKFGITPAESLPATAALNMAALERGADILRVHDVAEGRQVVDMYLELRREAPRPDKIEYFHHPHC